MPYVKDARSSMPLFLLRHAKAGGQGPDYPDDSQRPLIAKGVRQCRVLESFFQKQALSFDVVVSSPWKRAVQTSQYSLSQHDIHYSSLLTTNNYDAVLAYIHSLKITPDDNVICIGHEPWLSELCC